MTQKDTEFVVYSTYRLVNPFRRRIAQRVRYITLEKEFSTERKAQAEATRLVRVAKASGSPSENVPSETLIRIEVKRVETTFAWEGVW